MGIALGSSQIHLKLSHSITLAWRNLKRVVHRSHKWFAKRIWHMLYRNKALMDLMCVYQIVTVWFPYSSHTNKAIMNSAALPFPCLRLYM